MLPELAATLRGALASSSKRDIQAAAAPLPEPARAGRGAIGDGAPRRRHAPRSPTARATCCSPPRGCGRRWSPASRASPATSRSWSTSATSTRWAAGRSRSSTRCSRPGAAAAEPLLAGPRRRGAAVRRPGRGRPHQPPQPVRRRWPSRSWAARAACSPASTRARATSWSPPSTCAARCTRATRSGTPASTRRPSACAATTRCCPQLAEAGSGAAGKDISMGGLAGTTLMLLEGLGRRRDAVSSTRCRAAAASRGAHGCSPFRATASCCRSRPTTVRRRAGAFAARGIAAARVGRVDASRRLTLAAGGESAPGLGSRRISRSPATAAPSEAGVHERPRRDRALPP